MVFVSCFYGEYLSVVSVYFRRYFPVSHCSNRFHNNKNRNILHLYLKSVITVDNCHSFFTYICVVHSFLGRNTKGGSNPILCIALVGLQKTYISYFNETLIFFRNYFLGRIYTYRQFIAPIELVKLTRVAPSVNQFRWGIKLMETIRVYCPAT